MDEHILDFIRRRFSKDNHWHDGNCYWVAYILSEEFSCLGIAYLPADGHFVAMDKQTMQMYDANGRYYSFDTALWLSEIIEQDCVWYDRLMRDCRD